ncbi:MAG TPA: glutamine-hydrolyzing GMP synthase [Myxococcales bacterium]|nr:glutamine-hydrolyzing GMP synthase [Deltaproteobacteria bacterium]MBU50788.1 glutamine-hydrolyzing GMP synthase [Deltaproteobacteria bacterium]HAA53596.1 glutamine-hydrolyzing GMP synthase [Myxococcales bacterium]|tara:strand:+ start:7746 stop:9266 length:1521 start_codon:yes stop_codon:yes gene_type:complete
MITIIDCGSQLTQNIARRVRELGVYTDIVPFNTSVEEVLANKPEGLIISGGPFSVYDEGAPIYDKAFLDLPLPILGICYGLQSLTYLLGGEVTPTSKREYGEAQLVVEKETPLFKGFDARTWRIWMSHGDIVEAIPEGFDVIARSHSGHVAAIQKDNVFAVQYHPEVDHSEYGRELLENFINICDASRLWDPTKEYDRIVEETREQMKGRVGIGGISGGVDSSTLSVLMGQIDNDNYHPIFVDNGLLRLNEAEQVKSFLDPFGLNVMYVDASEQFLKKLEGVEDPDEKRIRIGHEFITVFEEASSHIEDVAYLAQGTLYPDVIESVPVYGASSEIKRHHNVGGLPETMKLDVVEPFRHLFKDEVRAIAEQKLGMPKDVVWRHPFPGPGLAVRIIGDITKEKLDLLRKADAIFIEELKQRELYYDIGQAFAVLTGAHSVGVMGDAGTYEGIVGLRAVTTQDYMTADWFDFKGSDLRAIANRIINEVPGVNRVVYDISQKPPSTIEWE